jgi:cellulose synthase/poly-beta-1,6-N-acetylglucosamine synthase-like glycosyltransferase
MDQDQAQAGEADNPRASDAIQGYDYTRFSTLAGALTEPPAGKPYRVQFKRLAQWRPVRTSLLVVLALAFVGGFFVWLMLPDHWPQDRHHLYLDIASIVMAVNTGVIGLFALINVTTLCRASLVARDPVPVSAETGTRVAFVTTIVPDREPIAIVRRTLHAALRIRHGGRLDVWLLDEGADPDVRDMCDELGVFYFTRNGVARWNQPAGAFKRKSKHGNYNSWLDAHGDRYDYMISVDPDHVPLENFAERFLGYFRDPDVAFVVGPQVYGNFSGFVTKAAESQQFLFHSLLQRAGNRVRTAMLVGTNNAVRLRALKAVGGLHDSVTEDMATSLAIHVARNEQTGRRWTSVYTPDVIAVGEGPASFTDYFSQQYRWSRGTDEVLFKGFWRVAHKLSPRQIFHYALLMSYYPTTAIAWMLGALNGVLFMTLHAGGVTVPMHLWLMLYADAAALQVSLYFWNRRHNVSPHERKGSSGFAGMFISTLSAPIYVSSLVGTLLRRSSGFVVTAKGEAVRGDVLGTFAQHLRWAFVIAVPFGISPLLSNADPWMYTWSLLALVVCLLPVAIWRIETRRGRGPRRRAGARTRARRPEPQVAAEIPATFAQGMEPA